MSTDPFTLEASVIRVTDWPSHRAGTNGTNLIRLRISTLCWQWSICKCQSAWSQTLHCTHALISFYSEGGDNLPRVTWVHFFLGSHVPWEWMIIWKTSTNFLLLSGLGGTDLVLAWVSCCTPIEWCSEHHCTPLLGLLCQEFFACSSFGRTVTWLSFDWQNFDRNDKKMRALRLQKVALNVCVQSHRAAAHQCSALAVVHCSRFELRSLRRGCCYSFAGIRSAEFQLLAASLGCLQSTCSPGLPTEGNTHNHHHRYDLWCYRVTPQRHCSHVASEECHPTPTQSANPEIICTDKISSAYYTFWFWLLSNIVQSDHHFNNNYTTTITTTKHCILNDYKMTVIRRHLTV